jgi:hypothetical protein
MIAYIELVTAQYAITLPFSHAIDINNNQPNSELQFNNTSNTKTQNTKTPKHHPQQHRHTTTTTTPPHHNHNTPHNTKNYLSHGPLYFHTRPNATFAQPQAWVATTDGKPDSSGMNCWLFSCVGRTVKHTGRVFGGTTSASCGGGPPPSPPSLVGSFCLSDLLFYTCFPE